MPRDAAEQYAYCVANNLTIPVATAEATYGALMFAEFDAQGNPHHVAISLGNGKVFAAMDQAQGIGIANVGTGFFTAGAYAPGLDYRASGGSGSAAGKAVP